jgi:hypothetical protein
MPASLERLFDVSKHLFGVGVTAMRLGSDVSTDREDPKKAGEQSQNDWIKLTS